MAGGAEARPATGRFLAGDPLRALAAIGVLVFHVANGVSGGRDRTGAFTAAYGHPWGYALQAGRLGVFVFFVLSGYLLSRPYLRSLVLGEPAPALAEYARNRALRIVPAFWVVAAITLIWFGTQGAGPDQVAAIFGFAHVYDPSPAATQLAHAWTLDVEVAYYAFLPLAAGALALAFRRQRGVRGRLGMLAVALVVVAAGSLTINTRLATDPKWILTLPPWLYAFAAGIGFAAIEVAIGGRLRGRLWASAAPIACLAGVVVLFRWGARDGPTPLVKALAAGGGASLIVGSMLLVQWSGRGCWRILDTAPLQLLGRWSYGIYLVQLPLIYALLPGLAVGQRPWVRLAAGLPLILATTVLAAAASYYLVERPALRLRAGAARSLHAPAAAAVAQETA